MRGHDPVLVPSRQVSPRQERARDVLVPVVLIVQLMILSTQVFIEQSQIAYNELHEVFLQRAFIRRHH